VLLRALLRRLLLWQLVVSPLFLLRISDHIGFTCSPDMSGGASVRRCMSAVNEQSPLLRGDHPFYNPVAGEFVGRVKRLILSDPAIDMMAAPGRKSFEALALLLLYPNLKKVWRAGPAFRADKKRVQCSLRRLYHEYATFCGVHAPQMYTDTPIALTRCS
jgi:hypothetical protein